MPTFDGRLTSWGHPQAHGSCRDLSPHVMNYFAAIDFETGDHGRDSACSVGVVAVENGHITRKFHRLIRPPRKQFAFTHIHGLTWNDVRRCPTFRDVWPELRDFIDKADFLVAHNAAFDSSVLQACCEASEIVSPALDFRCTMQMARTKWNPTSTGLASVCRALGIPLKHHDALSDAEACARIAIAAMRGGC